MRGLVKFGIFAALVAGAYVYDRDPARVEKRAQETAEKRNAGLHCLSGWSREHRDLGRVDEFDQA